MIITTGSGALVVGEPEEMGRVMVTAKLEQVIKALHDAEIQFGIQSPGYKLGISVWVRYDTRFQETEFMGTAFLGDWPADEIAAWMLAAAQRVMPCSSMVELA